MPEMSAVNAGAALRTDVKPLRLVIHLADATAQVDDFLDFRVTRPSAAFDEDFGGQLFHEPHGRLAGRGAADLPDMPQAGCAAVERRRRERDDDIGAARCLDRRRCRIGAMVGAPWVHAQHRIAALALDHRHRRLPDHAVHGVIGKNENPVAFLNILEWILERIDNGNDARRRDAVAFGHGHVVSPPRARAGRAARPSFIRSAQGSP
jgi:hypothetical protein